MIDDERLDPGVGRARSGPAALAVRDHDGDRAPAAAAVGDGVDQRLQVAAAAGDQDADRGRLVPSPAVIHR